MISGVVLARNEEVNIVACLQALRPHVEELLLIDMESSDRTIELAKPLVERVLHHPLVAEFDSARNVAVAHSRCDWFWFVDADERIAERTGQFVRQLIHEHGDEFEALVIPFKSYFCGQWMRHCGWWPGYTMPRVLKRGYFEFVGRLHGGVQVNGRQLRLPPDPELGVDHFSYRSVEHYLEKLNRYTSAEASQLASEGAQWDWRDAHREMIHDLWMYYEYNPGYLDKERGWILSWLSGQYRWLARAKLIDAPPTGDDKPLPFGGDAPTSLNEVTELWRAELARLRALYPRLPLGIVWRSPVFDPSGYADETRAFIKTFAAGERPLRLEEIDWSDKRCALEVRDERLLKVLTRVERPNHCVTVTNCIPTLVEPDPFAALNILRTTFETDRLPDGWLERLQPFDEIWVPCEQNLRSFRRSGLAPERIRVVPSCYDDELYQPNGPRLSLPPTLHGRFVFLSVFDWQLRKGWDVLLRAYVQEFRLEEGAALLLKITRAHGHTMPLISAQADQVLAEIGQALVDRPDIFIWDASLSAAEMAALYRSVSAFVLPTRGEGWGRPYMEAMACRIPTIGTRHSGNAAFMNDGNSFLIDASLAQVPEAAAREIPPYRGHRWVEPDLMALRSAMREVYSSSERCRQRTATAAQEIPARFGLEAGRRAIDAAVQEAERRFESIAVPEARPDQLQVVLEGEFFAHHSFSNINEQLAQQLSRDERVALSLRRIQQQPVFDSEVPHAWQLRPYFGRQLGQTSFTIRHAFPPNWQPVEHGLWIHIQPWEFGYLPIDWIEPLRQLVHEIWVPTRFVKDTFVRSGIPGEKIEVVPWGIDREVFRPDAEPLLLPTTKTFRFLFVGGLIGRKGFDTVLSAYLAEFSRDEDVCLVVKDLGSDTFYRYGNFREQLLAAKDNPSAPEIVYLQSSMTSGQLASLYTACKCFVAPYRAEGFGLPILEAMACGLAPIVPQGGASDDFMSTDTAYLLPSKVVESSHDWQLTGPPLELAIDEQHVRRTMRMAYEDRDRTKRLGSAAAQVTHERFTWDQTVNAIIARLIELKGKKIVAEIPESRITSNKQNEPATVGAWMVSRGAERHLPHALCQLAPFVDETLVVVAGEPDRAPVIAKEYGARVILAPDLNGSLDISVIGSETSAEWLFSVDPQDRLSDLDIETIRDHLKSVPAPISEVQVDIPRSRLANLNGEPPRLRIVRRATLHCQNKGQT